MKRSFDVPRFAGSSRTGEFSWKMPGCESFTSVWGVFRLAPCVSLPSCPLWRTSDWLRAWDGAGPRRRRTGKPARCSACCTMPCPRAVGVCGRAGAARRRGRHPPGGLAARVGTAARLLPERKLSRLAVSSRTKLFDRPAAQNAARFAHRSRSGRLGGTEQFRPGGARSSSRSGATCSKAACGGSNRRWRT